jgi:hypothetical protein
MKNNIKNNDKTKMHSIFYNVLPGSQGAACAACNNSKPAQALPVNCVTGSMRDGGRFMNNAET